MDDVYNKISDTHSGTVEGFFKFLDLPHEKQALVEKLKHLKEVTKLIPPRDKKKGN